MATRISTATPVHSNGDNLKKEDFEIEEFYLDDSQEPKKVKGVLVSYRNSKLIVEKDGKKEEFELTRENPKKIVFSLTFMYLSDGNEEEFDPKTKVSTCKAYISVKIT